MKTYSIHVYEHDTDAQRPPGSQRRLKARAAMEGMSMSEYVLGEVSKALERPTRQEGLERLRARPSRLFKRSAAEVVSAERDAR